MILPLRQRHRRTVVTLALLLPLMFVAAILARRPVPISAATLPDSIRSVITTNHAGSETGVPR